MQECYPHQCPPYFYEAASKDESPLPPSVLSTLYLGIPNLLKRENKGHGLQQFFCYLNIMDLGKDNQIIQNIARHCHRQMHFQTVRPHVFESTVTNVDHLIQELDPMISDRLAKEEDWKTIDDDQFIKIQLIEIGANQPKQGRQITSTEIKAASLQSGESEEIANQLVKPSL